MQLIFISQKEQGRKSLQKKGQEQGRKSLQKVLGKHSDGKQRSAGGVSHCAARGQQDGSTEAAALPTWGPGIPEGIKRLGLQLYRTAHREDFSGDLIVKL